MTTNSVNLKSTLVNICGLSDHSCSALQNYVIENEIHIVALCETVKDVKGDHFQGYKSFSKLNHRGASLSVANQLPSTKLNELENDQLDAVFAIITTRNEKLLVGAVYVPPEIQILMKVFLQTLEAVHVFCRNNDIKNMLILGDFNARHFAWNDHTTNKNGSLLYDEINQSSFEVFAPNVPTFKSRNGESTIDFCIGTKKAARMNVSCFVDTTVELFTGAPIQGHFHVTWNWNLLCDRENLKFSTWDLAHTSWLDWANQLESLCLENQQLLMNDDAGEVWLGLKSILSSNMTAVLKKKVVTNHSKPFWTPYLSSLSNELRAARKLFQHRNNDSNLSKLCEAKKTFMSELDKSRNSWIEANLDLLNKSSGSKFWKQYQRTVLEKEKNTIGPLKDEKGLLQCNIEEKAKLLQKCFFSGEHLESANFDEASHHQTADTLALILSQSTDCNLIQLDELSETLNGLKVTSKSFDPDGFHPQLVKQTGPCFRLFLLHLFNSCLRTSNWVWKDADVTFIPKSGKKDYFDPKSYRPISLTSCIGKTLELVLAKRLLKTFDDRLTLEEEQEGFRKKRGASRLLYRIFADISKTKYLNQKGILVSIDLEKAFDSVDTSILLLKLYQAGVSQGVLLLIHNYLSTRRARIKLGNTRSESFDCRIGVPQGGVLSPLIF